MQRGRGPCLLCLLAVFLFLATPATAEPLADQPAGLFSTGFADIAPTIHVFESAQHNITTFVHFVPGDGNVTQPILDAKAIDWGIEIDDVWNAATRSSSRMKTASCTTSTSTSRSWTRLSSTPTDNRSLRSS